MLIRQKAQGASPLGLASGLTPLHVFRFENSLNPASLPAVFKPKPAIPAA